MKLQVGDRVRIKPRLLDAPFAALLGKKAQRLVGMQGVVEAVLVEDARPFFVYLVAEWGPVYIRLRRDELSLVTPVGISLGFGKFALERMKGLALA